LLDHDRGRRAAHAGRLHRHRPALELTRVAEHAALAVSLYGMVKVRLGDVLGAQRIPRQQAGLRIVAGLGADVNRHDATLSGAGWAALRRPAKQPIASNASGA